MIIEHVCEGSLNTTCHNFKISIDGMNLHISSGKYIVNNEVVYEAENEGVLSVATDEFAMYKIAVTREGFLVLKANTPDEMIEMLSINKEIIIDKLIWFDVEEDTKSLLDVDVHFRRVTGLEERENENSNEDDS